MPAKKTAAARRAGKTILIVDDHPMFRRGVTALVAGEPGLSVCGQASSIRDAMHLIALTPPDLAIVDLSLEGEDGLDLVRDVKRLHPAVPVLVLSMHDEALYAERAIRAGASGYISKQQMDDTILIAIHRVLDGHIYLSPSMESRLARKYLNGGALADDSPLAVLTDRELQVFRLIGSGESTRMIAKRLHLSVKTIESHREHIKNKLTIQTGAALVRRAIQWVDTGRTD